MLVGRFCNPLISGLLTLPLSHWYITATTIYSRYHYHWATAATSGATTAASTHTTVTTTTTTATTISSYPYYPYLLQSTPTSPTTTTTTTTTSTTTTNWTGNLLITGPLRYPCKPLTTTNCSCHFYDGTRVQVESQMVCYLSSQVASHQTKSQWLEFFIENKDI